MKFNKRRVLIAPLDWGLGHATRCIPVVKAFINRGWEVIVAAEGAGEYLLKQEFPGLQFIGLKGYRVEYSSRRWSLPFKIAAQVPKLLSSIRREHQWLQGAIEKYGISLIVSDNRFGLYTDKVHCIFLTHQLQIKAPYRWMEKRLRQLNYKYISRYTECWVPDVEVYSLAGELSHPSDLHPFPLRYVGPLSRFKKQMTAIRYRYVFLISGPEPQRSILEKRIAQDIDKIQGDVLVIRGKPGSDQQYAMPDNVTVVDHLEGEALEKALNSAEYIISRSGYTTLMEVAALQKRAVFIPTPGQTEQEYLASYLMERRLAYSVDQRDFKLPETLESAQQFPYKPYPVVQNQLDVVIDDFLSRHFNTIEQPSFAAP